MSPAPRNYSLYLLYVSYCTKSLSPEFVPNAVIYFLLLSLQKHFLDLPLHSTSLATYANLVCHHLGPGLQPQCPSSSGSLHLCNFLQIHAYLPSFSHLGFPFGRSWHESLFSVYQINTGLHNLAFRAQTLYSFLSLSAFHRLMQPNFYWPIPGPHPCSWLRQPQPCICPESLNPFLLLWVNPGPLPP